MAWKFIGALKWWLIPKYPREMAKTILDRDVKIGRLHRSNRIMLRCLTEIELFGHSDGHGRGYTCADMAKAAIEQATKYDE